MEPDHAEGFDPAAALARIDDQTARLLASAAGLDDAAVRAPSLLPGWSRGHVLTHLARNADGGTRLLTWARTGVESYEYPSVAARAAEIEAGSGRSAAHLLDDLRQSCEAFAAAYRLMSPQAWFNTVRWTTGEQLPASSVALERLTEVMVHHVDLDTPGYSAEHWPANFSGPHLARVAAAFSRRPDGPRALLVASDTGARHRIGEEGADGPVVEGTQNALLAWIMGRSDGAGLTVRHGQLPPVPALY